MNSGYRWEQYRDYLPHPLYPPLLNRRGGRIVFEGVLPLQTSLIRGAFLREIASLKTSLSLRNRDTQGESKRGSASLT